MTSNVTGASKLQFDSVIFTEKHGERQKDTDTGIFPCDIVLMKINL